MNNKSNARRRALVAICAGVLVFGACTGADDGPEPAAADGEETEVDDAPGDATTDDKWCGEVDIAAFAGGGQGTPFTNNVHNGYQAAEADLGPNVTYYFSDWDVQQMVAQFDDALAQEPDGMAVMGHPGDAAMGPKIDEAYEAGVQVTVVNVELPESMDDYAPDGTGYVGAPNYDAGKRLADETVARSGAEAGEVAFVWGLLAEEGRGERTRGIIDGFEEAGLTVVYEEIDSATNADAPAGTPTFAAVMAANPDVSVVVTDHGALTATAQLYMEAADLDPDDVYFAGFDLGPASVEAIQSGYLDLLIDQQPFLQGYLPILQICLTQVYGFSGLYIDTAGAFVDADNVDSIAELARQEIR
jgi:simple sugar transport system substrate-binding protein